MQRIYLSTVWCSSSEQGQEATYEFFCKGLSGPQITASCQAAVQAGNRVEYRPGEPGDRFAVTVPLHRDPREPVGTAIERRRMETSDLLSNAVQGVR